MTIYSSILGIIWVIFILVWVIGMFFAKRTARRSWMGIWWRLAIIMSVIALVHFLHGSSYLSGAVHSPALNSIGLMLAALGVALAIWARFYLGSNWGMPLTVKENAELVTSGPYAHIRHPIYSGILLALLGSSLVIWWWAVIFIWSFIYFIAFATHGEEALMCQEFPDTYPTYKARTKRLIPWVY